MVQTGMTTPYTAFAQQNGGPGAGGDTTSLKADMKAVDGGPPGGGGGGSPNGVTAQQALQALQHANGVVDQQQNATVMKVCKTLNLQCYSIRALQGDDGSQVDVATSLAAVSAAVVAAAQQSQPNPAIVSHTESQQSSVAKQPENTPKRLHVSNIPFRFRDPDLRNMFGVRNLAFIVSLSLEEQIILVQNTHFVLCVCVDHCLSISV